MPVGALIGRAEIHRLAGGKHAPWCDLSVKLPLKLCGWGCRAGGAVCALRLSVPSLSRDGVSEGGTVRRHATCSPNSMVLCYLQR